MISYSMSHIHHKIPKHMGGSNDPSNLIKLTIPAHAEEHRLLYVKHGHWQDYIAWKGLSGQIEKEEIIRLVVSNANRGVNNFWFGKERPDTVKRNIENNSMKPGMTSAGSFKSGEDHLFF